MEGHDRGREDILFFGCKKRETREKELNHGETGKNQSALREVCGDISFCLNKHGSYFALL